MTSETADLGTCGKEKLSLHLGKPRTSPLRILAFFFFFPCLCFVAEIFKRERERSEPVIYLLLPSRQQTFMINDEVTFYIDLIEICILSRLFIFKVDKDLFY